MPIELIEAFLESPKLWLALLLAVGFLAGRPADLATGVDPDE